MNKEQLSAIDKTAPDRIAQLQELHRALYGPGEEPAISYAPGRAEILGSHTDYNQGYTLSANVGNNLLVAATPRADTTVRMASMSEGREVLVCDAASSSVIWDSKSQGGTTESWSNYVKGVVWAYAAQGHEVKGFNMVVDSTIPAGAGLSSSAALETAVSRIVDHLNGLGTSVYEQVGLCKKAENEYVGAPCGYLDQATVGLADNWQLMSYRPEGGKPFRYAQLQSDIEQSDQVLVVGYDPLSKHALVDGKYAVRQQACFDGVTILGELLKRNINALRDVSSAELEEVTFDLAARKSRKVAKFVTHVVHENERVLAAQTALEADDFDRFGKLMTASGASALNLYELDEDAPELRHVYETVAGDAVSFGVSGIRNMGGGFNATTLALVGRDKMTTYRGMLGESYRSEFGRDYNFIDFVPAPAAGMLEDQEG